MSDVKLLFACWSCGRKLHTRVCESIVLTSSPIKKFRTFCTRCDELIVVMLPKRDVKSKPKQEHKIVKKPSTRNERRNLAIGHDRQCKYCDFVWPASTHLGRFESYQSRCKLGKMACCNVRVMG